MCDLDICNDMEVTVTLKTAGFLEICGLAFFVQPVLEINFETIRFDSARKDTQKKTDNKLTEASQGNSDYT